MPRKATSTAIATVRGRPEVVRVLRARSHRRAKTQLSAAMIAGLAPTLVFALEGFKAEGPLNAVERVGMRLTGYNPWSKSWEVSELAKGWLPLLAGVLVHRLANKVGINRQIARMGIPIFRI